MNGSLRRSLAVLLTLVATLATACAPTATPPPSESAPTRGGTMVFAIWQEPTTLFPLYTNQTVAFAVSDVVNEGLTRTSNEGTYIPQLAKQVPTIANGGVKLSADGKKMDVSYELRSDIKWSDGSPFTSADVKFTWETLMKDPKVTTREGYDLIESIDTPTPTSAIVHYKQIYGAYLTRFTTLISKSVEKEPDFSKSVYNFKPIGTGPFVISEFVAGDHITAERNPNYREQGKPYLDRLIFRSVPSREAAIAQLKAGEVDGVWNLLEAQAPELEKEAGVRIVSTPSSSVERLELNQAKNADPADPAIPHPVLSELAVRRALNLATPKQQIIDKLLFGKAKIGTSPVSQGWAAPKGLSQEAYDLKLANTVLDQAGWLRGTDGIRTKNGNRAALTITTTTGDKVREQIEQILVDEWKQIGVELTLRNQPSSVLLSGSWTGGDPRKRGSFDVVLYASAPAIDPNLTMQRYTSGGIPTAANGGLGQNFTRFRNAEADAHIAEAAASVDLVKRADLYAKALKLLNDNVAIIWLYDKVTIDAFRTTVSGPKGNVWQNITSNAADWSIKK